jgi:hypothetical protein
MAERRTVTVHDEMHNQGMRTMIEGLGRFRDSPGMQRNAR